MDAGQNEGPRDADNSISWPFIFTLEFGAGILGKQGGGCQWVDARQG